MLFFTEFTKIRIVYTSCSVPWMHNSFHSETLCLEESGETRHSSISERHKAIYVFPVIDVMKMSEFKSSLFGVLDELTAIRTWSQSDLIGRNWKDVRGRPIRW